MRIETHGQQIAVTPALREYVDVRLYAAIDHHRGEHPVRAGGFV